MIAGLFGIAEVHRNEGSIAQRSEVPEQRPHPPTVSLVECDVAQHDDSLRPNAAFIDPGQGAASLVLHCHRAALCARRRFSPASDRSDTPRTGGRSSIVCAAPRRRERSSRRRSRLGHRTPRIHARESPTCSSTGRGGSSAGLQIRLWYTNLQWKWASRPYGLGAWKSSICEMSRPRPTTVSRCFLK